MCRFVAFSGQKNVDVSPLLLKVKNSLLQQSKSDESGRPNPDGWGLAYQDNARLRIVKSAAPAYRDEKFIREAQNINSRLVFAHVRRRSHGIVHVTNSHPFTSGKWMFMHNGAIPNLKRFKVRLRKRLPKEIILETTGTTDSEFLFKYFLLLLEKKADCDVTSALNIIYNIIHEILEIVDPSELEQLALNFLLTNCEYIIGYRRHRSLYYCHSNGGTIISSEPLGIEASWNEVPENHFIISLHPGDVKIAAFDIALEKQEIEWT